MDLTEALEAAGIEFRNHQSNDDEIWICCPFCTDKGESPDERFRLGVNTVTGKAHCFNCDWRGNGDYTFSKLQESLDTGDIEAQQEERKHKKKKHIHVELPEGFHPLPDSGHWARVAYRYLRSRGITDRQIEEREIGYTEIGDFHHRIVFPVYVYGKLKGIVGRDMTEDQELKYMNSIGDKTLYNVKKRPEKAVCLFEGVFDTLVAERPARKLGIDTNGLLGHNLQSHQVELLDPYKTIYAWLDPDKAGLEGYRSLRKTLPQDKVLRIVLPRGFAREGAVDKDPSELPSEVITKRLSHAVVYTESLELKLKAWMAFED